MNTKTTSLIASLWITMLLTFSGCGSSLKIYSDIDDTGRFGQYSTYSFIEFSEGNKKTINGMELERIRVAFARELEQRGLKFVDQDADVSVQIVVYHRQANDASYGYYGAYNYMERALAVDMYDNLTRTHVWHCAAVGELVYDPSERADALPGVVSELFDKYPMEVTGGE
jgi:hypothetical protein